ncbi:OpgC domain-containing protein [Pontixanthobacter gangjinensis]|uniref:OpgC protein n=1 Tax=Pontixanthobacter gangjinensis TaxID=1028742 RepID=A0A6I4SJ77_9SPHN|nr:OpgC domain-containing protein [Pontixanthobacter gangjinensis]MXO55468.1 hypothetical protein [Pontixanthobacter gangjinensis]
MSSSSLSPQRSHTRIHAIDAIRGFCLLNIFVNHITVGFLNGLSPSRIMFSDSAEAFVFLAGISCFLAYGAYGGKNFTAINRQRIWHRAITLLWVNSLIALISVAILLIAARIATPAEPSLFPTELIKEHGIVPYLWHVLTMQETAGYSVVLRLYVALMLAAPLYIWLAGKRFWYPLIPAGLLWLGAGHFGLAESNSLSGVPLALTLLPWNMVFASGIALGAAIAQGKALPQSRPLTFAAAALVLAGPVCFTVLTRLSPDILAWVDTRNDYFWTGASKSLQSPLRVAYMLALAYLVIALRKAPVIRLVYGVSPGNVLTILGRRSLEVFSVGAVLALVADQVLWALFTHDVVTSGSLGAIAIEGAMCGLAVFAMLRAAQSKRFTADAIGSTIARFMTNQAAPTQTAAKI